MTIGSLAQRTGFNVSAIRYYEEVGLIPLAACPLIASLQKGVIVAPA